MRIAHFLSTMLCLVAVVVCARQTQAATINAFWSFQTTLSGGTYTPTVTAETFPGTPTFVRASSGPVDVGGELSFTDFQSNTWTGSGTSATGGFSAGFNNNTTGNSFILGLDMTDVEDLSVRMAIRPAGVSPTSFSAIEYNINNTGWVSTGISSSFPNSLSFSQHIYDFSSISAIEDQSGVQIRFSIPNVLANSSFRVDNIQLTAAEVVPEPATFGLAGIGALGLFAFARRRRVA